MNKVLHINIGGYAFIIDEDAYDDLKIYLSRVRLHFSNSTDCDEILDDIEARMAELFTDRLGDREIISTEDIQHVVTVMGTPAEFEGGMEDVETESRKSNTAIPRRVTKRLFRNPEEKVILGVASGMTAYFGIQDPLWMRLLFVLLFMMGPGLPIYIVLGLIVPKAKTSADFLAMHGEPVDISSIARVVEEGVDSISSSINDLTKKKKK